MLTKSCLLFMLPSLTGLIILNPLTSIGCAILTITSLCKYYKPHNIRAHYIDLIYAMSFTFIATCIGAVKSCNGCSYHTLGVICSILATVIYFKKSRLGNEKEHIFWHAMVHLVGAIGFTVMNIVYYLQR